MTTKSSAALVVLSILASASLPSVSFAVTAMQPVPCENALKELRTAVGGAKLNDTDKAKVADLQAKGLERCKADDDAGADAFFADAMKLLPK
jgi:hypothetical protein